MEATHPEQTMATLKEVSVDTAIPSTMSELESTSSLNEERRTVLKAFLDGKDVLALLPTSFGI